MWPGAVRSPASADRCPQAAVGLHNALGRQRVAVAWRHGMVTHTNTASSVRRLMREAGQARHPPSPAGASSKVPPCTTASQHGSGPRTWQRRPKTKRGNLARGATCGARAPKGWRPASSSARVPTPGCLRQRESQAASCPGLPQEWQPAGCWVPDPGCLHMGQGPS